MSVDLITHALASKGKKAPKGGKKQVRHMHITKAHSGGYHIRHEHDQPGQEATEHVAPDTDALHDHIEEHFGEANPGEQAQAAPAQGQGEEAEA